MLGESYRRSVYNLTKETIVYYFIYSGRGSFITYEDNLLFVFIMHSPSHSVGEGFMFSGCSSAAFVRSSRVIVISKAFAMLLFNL